MDNFVLNRERKGLSVGVKSFFGSLEIKDTFNKLEELSGPVYIPGDLAKEPEGYRVYIRNRTSLKEYLGEAPVNLNMIRAVIEGLCRLWNFSREAQVSFYNFLFDYDGIFISGVMESVEFLYLPGAKMGKQNNSLEDLFTILHLHGEDTEDKYLSGILREARELIHVWEGGRGAFPEVSLKALLPEKRGFGFHFLRLPIQVKWTLLLSDFTLPGKEEITVGRDSVWADLAIGDARISRRHAVIIQKKRSVIVRDLFSSNGTFVDGQRIVAGEEVCVRGGQIISFGEISPYCVKFRPRILFSGMVK